MTFPSIVADYRQKIVETENHVTTLECFFTWTNHLPVADRRRCVLHTHFITRYACGFLKLCASYTFSYSVCLWIFGIVRFIHMLSLGMQIDFGMLCFAHMISLGMHEDFWNCVPRGHFSLGNYACGFSTLCASYIISLTRNVCGFLKVRASCTCSHSVCMWIFEIVCPVRIFLLGMHVDLWNCVLRSPFLTRHACRFLKLCASLPTTTHPNFPPPPLTPPLATHPH